MEELCFAVQGSAPEPYEVRFIRRQNGNLTAYCTCAAGLVGQYCKHRFRILAGDPEGVVSTNLQQVSIVANWLPGTDVQEALDELAAAEARLADAKRLVSAAKKALAAAMKD